MNLFEIFVRKLSFVLDICIIQNFQTSFTSSSQFTEDEAQSDCTSRADEIVDVDNFFHWRKNPVKVCCINHLIDLVQFCSAG